MKVKRWYTIMLFVAACLAVNCAGKFMALGLQLPLWLDSFGTVLAAYVLGPVCGAMVGMTGNIIYSIVSLAATGVNGVERISLRITDEIMDKLSLTTTIKGVKIGREPEGMTIWVYLIMEPGVDIVKVSREVQEKVKSEVESISDLQVVAVNVRIEGSGV